MVYGRYGRRFHRGAGTGSRSTASYRRARPTTRKVYRKLRKAPVKRTKYQAAKNTAAVKRLKTVVNQGQVQRNLQFLDTSTGVGSLTLTPTQNIFFPANDMTQYTHVNNNGGLVFINQFQTTPAGQVPSHQWYGNWRYLSPGFQMSMPVEYRQWSTTNVDQAAPTGFMPVSAKYTFNFMFGTIASTEPDMYLRFDIIRPKKNYVVSNRTSNMLPKSGGALAHMAMTPYGDQKNSYNPELWHVKTIWRKIPRADIVRTNYQCTVPFTIKFPAKRINLNLESIDPEHFEAFWENCPLSQQMWVNINISDYSSQTAAPRINAVRQIVFRDHKGGTN